MENFKRQANPERVGFFWKPLIKEPTCSRCLMDASDPNLSLDSAGVCNHCLEYDKMASVRMARPSSHKNQLAKIAKKIKIEGRGKRYDCIAGVSGGVDSTYIIHVAKQLGLRPLAVHFDNGWNSELAVNNIQTTLDKLNVDLFTYVVDWAEFKDLQRSFLFASTPDAEIPTDHGIYALLIRTALKHEIRYVLNGMNFASEGISIPAWAYGHSDWRYIKNVHRIFGTVRLKSFPHFSLPFLSYALLLKRVTFISPLNYMEYDKEKACGFLESELGWRPYGGKHHESIYTRFFQSYILPIKFGIDKRKAHISNLIHSGSGSMTRELGLKILTESPCDPRMIERDRDYIIKKLGLSEAQFEQIMCAPIKKFSDYKNNMKLIRRFKLLQNHLRKIGAMYK